MAAALPAVDVFAPWLNGERTPVDDPHLRGGFHNMSTTTTLEDMVRALYAQGFQAVMVSGR